MSRIILLILILAFPFAGNTQLFNKSCGAAGNLLDMTRTPVVDIANKTIFLTGYDKNDKILFIYRTDLSGNYLSHVAFDNVFFADHDIIGTKDGGLLLAAHFNDYLYVVHFFNNLTLDWSKKIFTGSAPAPQGGIFADNSVAITKSADQAGLEHYYICCQAPSLLSTTGYFAIPNDIAFDVVDITEAQQMIWHRNYTPSTGVRFTIDYDVVTYQDFITSITPFIDAEGDEEIGLAGVHFEVGTIHNDVQPFFLGLKKSDGGIELAPRRPNIGNYKPYAPKIVYNPYLVNKMGCALTIEDNATGVKSAAFLEITINANPGGINGGLKTTGATRYHIENQTYGNSISVRSDKDYVIGDIIKDDLFTYPGLMHISYMSPFNAAASSSYSHFADHGIVGNHVTDMITKDNYQTSLCYNSAGSFRVARMIKTDGTLYTACGEDIATPLVEPLSVVNTKFNNNQTVGADWEPYTPSFTVINVYNISCQPNTPFSRMSFLPKDPSATVQPTLVTGAEPLTCSIDVPEASSILIMIYDNYGHFLYNEKFKIASGTTTINLPVERLVKGLNFIKIVKGEEQLSITKVTLL
jgi:hypothetical protein